MIIYLLFLMFDKKLKIWYIKAGTDLRFQDRGGLKYKGKKKWTDHRQGEKIYKVQKVDGSPIGCEY